MEQNKQQKKVVLFLTVYTVILFLIALINFYADPYGLFCTQLQINADFNENPYLKIKLSKHQKFKYVITGGSSTKFLELYKINEDLADVSVYNASIQKLESILTYYLEIHPETKVIYFPIDFYLLELGNRNEVAVKYDKNKHITTEEFYRMFLSIDTTKKSLKKIIYIIRKDYEKVGLIQGDRNKEINYKVRSKKQRKQYGENSILALNETFNKIKDVKKEVKIVCYVLPTSVYNQYSQYKAYKEQIDDIKRFIVKRTGMLIDMDLVNEYTTEPITNNRYFFDSIHPKPVLNKYIYQALTEKSPNKNNDFYKILTKDNIDFELKKEKENLLNYINKHQSEYEAFKKQRDF